jgi:hypothetical protein
MNTEKINMGGGNIIEMLRMKGGEVVAFNDETLCIYQSESDFWANMDGQEVPIKLFYLERNS